MMKKNHNNKSIVSEFYSKVLRNSDLTLADKIIKENYIQHSPTVKTGKAGLMELLTFLKEIPKPENPVNPFFRFIADGEFIAVHISIEFMGQLKAVVDLFRLEGGQLAEHWDASEDIPEIGENDHDVVAGALVSENEGDSAQHKLLVKDYVQQVLIAERNNWKEYISEKLIQHNPMISDGIDSLKVHYQNCKKIILHKVLSEGDFVITQSEMLMNNLPVVVYDIYRMENLLIVEHWSVKQEIPESMAHDNGMI